MGQRASVLLVEDEPDVQESFKFMLESEGYSVVTADNGRDALNQLRRGFRPTLILLDLMMPVMDGFEFRRAQLRDARLAVIPVVVYSGHHDVKANAAQLRAAAYLQKPVDPDVLLELISTHCAAAR